MLSFFMKTALVTQTRIFEIFQNFRPFAFIQRFRQPFPKVSVEIITADFRIILQKRHQEKCSFFEDICGRSVKTRIFKKYSYSAYFGCDAARKDASVLWREDYTQKTRIKPEFIRYRENRAIAIDIV
ncbi:hypothetical protein EO98_05330 [Methanosarcina sp. 2.H.T.1A.6]|nr:hypothetical protein EO94_02075 [Methanosarcina sp. 2.H.T.1A.3]KKG15133.1 hypothetical protein EO97_18005 [Methanosarcina sp. 2.H.T.1A.15]KKG24825.1 hypothetical protein EO98_05330 [Methanosarcina sp. 2.H.T.1A.6]KKG26057.1 hypothetical protein EO96_16265 [Methanosarcina sp. 2.H.T.1A.8]